MLKARDPITTVQFAPDDSAVLAGTTAGDVYMWDVRTARQLFHLTTSGGEILSLAIGRSPHRLLVASEDGAVTVCDSVSGKHITRHVFPEPISGAAISKDGTRVAGVDIAGKIHLMDVALGKLTISLDDQSGILCVALSPSNDKVATCGTLCSVHVWDLRKQEKLAALSQNFPGAAIAFSPNGNLLATVEWNSSIFIPAAVRIWDVRSEKALTSLRGHRIGLTCVAFSPQGSLVATGGYDKTARIWAVPSNVSGR